jgi:hypothetical protein
MSSIAMSSAVLQQGMDHPALGYIVSSPGQSTSHPLSPGYRPDDTEIKLPSQKYFIDRCIIPYSPDVE